MSDIIQLLPDSVANQIAAGEVIQRPASAVKELLENAIDAGSTRIEVFIKDSGKTLIQVLDDGTGMSPADARLAFERHATSKIRSADDLFTIRTMGFRGEALASIAAIAQVEIKTRKSDADLGTVLFIEGSEFKKQEPSGVPAGTSIAVKNLFYNVPARRNFLKSDSIEARHIIDEFERVAYANPEIAFKLNQNGVVLFQLPASNFRQRIVNINGVSYNERLVPVDETTSLLSITGFIGKPEFSKKTRGEQFFFVNKRFIKDGYLHHAVTKAFEELLPPDSFASYWLCIDIDPSRIDVNIHPTKTEIKFEDERSIYAIVRSAVKRSLGLYNVSPTLNFEHEKSFDVPHAMRHQPVGKPSVTINTRFNPFESSSNKFAVSAWPKEIPSQPSDYRITTTPGNEQLFPDAKNDLPVVQMGNYILSPVEEGLYIFDVKSTLEAVFYKRFFQQLQKSEGPSQQCLFPKTITLTSSDYELTKEIMDELKSLGFDLQEFGPNCYAIHGVPPDIETGSEKEILESLIEDYKNSSGSLSTGSKEKIARSMARSLSRKKITLLSQQEMKALVSESIHLEGFPNDYGGKPFMILLKTGELEAKFKR